MYQTQLEPRTGAIGEVSTIVGANTDAPGEVTPTDMAIKTLF